MHLGALPGRRRQPPTFAHSLPSASLGHVLVSTVAHAAPVKPLAHSHSSVSRLHLPLAPEHSRPLVPLGHDSSTSHAPQVSGHLRGRVSRKGNARARSDAAADASSPLTLNSSFFLQFFDFFVTYFSQVSFDFLKYLRRCPSPTLGARRRARFRASSSSPRRPRRRPRRRRRRRRCRRSRGRRPRRGSG